MPISIVRLGSPRERGEGLRLGTVRRPPRGVSKADFARLDYYDLWFPLLAPSAALVDEARHAADGRAWKLFEKKYRQEMNAPDASRVLDLLRKRGPLPSLDSPATAGRARRGPPLRTGPYP
jgi:uncharacterized protein YeaO (DUF488 family)